ncbi:MAG: glycosyltransferase family 4 protein [Nitrososphaeria archaeon]
MKIVHVYHSYYPRIGGLERVVQCLAEEQAKLGHEVHVVTSVYETAKCMYEVINKVHVHRVKKFKFHYPDLTVPREYHTGLLKDADIVHIYSQNSLFSILIGEKAKKVGSKIACHFLAVNALNDHPNFLVRYLGTFYSNRNTSRALKFSDVKFVMGFRDKYILKSIYNVSDAHVLPDGVSQQYFTKPKCNVEIFRRKFKVKQEKLFLFIGRMHKLKGPHTIIKALTEVKHDTAVVFIGPDDGYLKNCLKIASALGVSDRVYTLGYVDEGTKIAAIDSAIAVISPSLCNYVEVFPIAIWEAWARSKPVIASRVGDIPYRIKQGVNGLLFDPHDHKQLAKCMSTLLNDQELADKIGREGKKYVLTWDKIALEAVKLYAMIT